MLRKATLAGLVTTTLLMTSCGQTTGVEALDNITQQATQILGSNTTSNLLSTADISAGLKQALEVGSSNVVSQLGQSNGFNSDPKIRIPLPKALQDVQKTAAKFGLDGQFNDLQNKLNAAAESATPKAKSLFVEAIQDMSIDDAKTILNGPDNAATEYFKGRMSGPLGKAMEPVINESMAEVGALQSYNELRSNVGAFAPDVQADMTQHVLDKGMDGIFFYLAQEEAAIRQDPAKRTTELLQKVFAQ